MNYSFSEQNGILILKINSLINPLDNQEIVSAVEQKILDNYNEFVIDLENMEFMNEHDG